MMIILKEFSELTVPELYSILKLRSEVFVVEQECVYQDIDNNDQISKHLFIKDKDEVIGYVRIVLYKDKTSIGRVVVHKDHRHNGYAISLMNYAIDYIYTKLDKKEIVISAQKYLTNFYQSLGFNQVGETYLEDDIPHIKMIHTKNT